MFVMTSSVMVETLSKRPYKDPHLKHVVGVVIYSEITILVGKLNSVVRVKIFSSSI